MARKQWTYTDEGGNPQTEDVSIYHKKPQADSQPAGAKIHPDNAHGTHPLTNGWKLEKPWGEAFTFQFARLGSMLEEIEKKGVAEWSTLTDYSVPAMVWGSDGNLYVALQASGPGSTPKNPISEPTYWRELFFSGGTGLQSVMFEHRENQGAYGGSMSGDTVRPINHIVYNDLSPDFIINEKGAPLNENTFKPAQGTYEIEAEMIHSECDRIRTWFYNITAARIDIVSNSLRSFNFPSDGRWITLPSTIRGRKYFNGTDIIQILGFASNPADDNAMGYPTNRPGQEEIYMNTKMTRISLVDITS
jgi:hypothetical protein